jgi:hypothetical protein
MMPKAAPVDRGAVGTLVNPQKPQVPKTAADRAVESVLAKYAGPHGKNAVRVPLSKGTRFKKLKDKLSKKKGR